MHPFPAPVVVTRYLPDLRAAVLAVSWLAQGCGGTSQSAAPPTATVQAPSQSGTSGSVAAPGASEPASAGGSATAASPAASSPANVDDETKPTASSPANVAEETKGNPPGNPPEGAAEAPAPHVSVKYIGLHVGGGPNDKATKAPFERAIARHFPELARCYATVARPGVAGTFGVDLLVPASGGRAQTSNSRTALPGDAFRDCVTHVFETVEFEKPKHGATKLSYAVRFDPEGA